MDLIAQKVLFDALTRQAMFIEQVKAGEAQQFSAVLAQIKDIVDKQLSRIKYQTLDQMSKTELTGFIKALRTSQSKVYSRYQQQLIVRLEQFMKATVMQTAIVSGSIIAHNFEYTPSPPVLLKTAALTAIVQANRKADHSALFGVAWLTGSATAWATLWSKIKSTPMPSGGALLINFVNTAIATSMVNVENAVRHAWTNNEPVADLHAAILGGLDGDKAGPSGAGTSSVTSKIQTTMRAVTNTVIQNIGQQSINTAASAVWPEYVWVSVLDDRTSEICRSRNGMVYQYGKGPLPPAHPNCRSHVMPKDTGEQRFEIPTFFDWLKSQPSDFIKQVFGGTIAGKFKDGSIVQDDYAKFKPLLPVTISEFAALTADLL